MIDKYKSLEVHVKLCMEYKKDNINEESIIFKKWFNAKMKEILIRIRWDIWYNFRRNIKKIENINLPSSGFVLNRIIKMEIDYTKLKLTRGSSYIELPKWIKNKKAIINPINKKDNECFKWSVIASLHHSDIKQNPERVTKLKKYENLYNWTGLTFPVSINVIKGFEKNNPDITIHVFFFFFHFFSPCDLQSLYNQVL